MHRKSTALLFLLLALVLVAGFVHAQKHFIDYHVYETAGLKVLAGNVAALYDKPGAPPDGFYYAYVFALAFSPLSALGPAGRFALVLLFFAAYLKILHFSIRETTAERPPLFAAALVLLTLNAINNGFYNANIGPLLMALCLIAFDLREKRPWLAGGFLGFAIAVKSYPVLVLGYFIWEKRYRVCVSAAATALFCLFLLPMLVYGPAHGLIVAREYFTMLSQFETLWVARGWHFGLRVFQNLTATAIRWGAHFGIAPGTALRASMLAGTAALVLFFLPSFLQRRETLPERFRTRMFFLALAAVPMLTPISWHNMQLFYAPLLADVLASAVFTRQRGAIAAITLYTALTCLTTPDIVGRAANVWFAEWGFPWVGIMALVIVEASLLLRDYPQAFSLTANTVFPFWRQRARA